MGRGKNKNHGRAISGEEARLWFHVARTATPISGADRVRDIEDFADLLGDTRGPIAGGGGMRSPALHPTHPPQPIESAGLLRQFSAGKNHTVGKTQAVGRTQASGPVKQPAPAPFDKRNLRRISRGRIEIDARIDLHGLRQREAHSALRSFLFNAHAKGHRIVLVITGKGRAEGYGSSNGDDWSMGHIETGVLKRNVPFWLAEADLSAIVVSHTSAGPHHGGDGALFIHLRRRMHAKHR